jgi:hypothetical protein
VSNTLFNDQRLDESAAAGIGAAIEVSFAGSSVDVASRGPFPLKASSPAVPVVVRFPPSLSLACEAVVEFCSCRDSLSEYEGSSTWDLVMVEF